MNIALVRCPKCRTPLSDSRRRHLTCARCDTVYPVLGSIPVLVPEPCSYLARSFVAVSSARRRAMDTLSEVERVRRSEAFAFRRDLMGRVSSGLALNLSLLAKQERALRTETRPVERAVARGRIVSSRIFERIAQMAGKSLSPSFLDKQGAQTGYDFDAALDYLRADWAGTPEGERQIEALHELVSASIERYCDRTGRAVYLGAGLGRLAFEGGKLLSSVVAAELSFAAAGLFAAVREAPVEFCTVNWQGAATDRELAELHRAAFPEEETYGANVTYVVADALSLPIADASLEAVVSVFFTDVVPSSKLLPEVRRVLRPGGKFISVGPLQYHFKDKGEWLTRPEMKSVLENVHRMTLEPGDSVHEIPFMERPGTRRTIFRVWSFVATRR